MKILHAEFVTSVAAGGRLPARSAPVVAMIGRSNVGKSSLINALTRSRIARAGAKPGTTRLVNIYAVRAAGSPKSKALSLTLADLPGYGFARGGSEARHEFDQVTRDFFAQAVLGESPARAETGRFRLAGAVLVVDGRHPGLESDLAARAWIAEREYPHVVVVTKNDRLSRSAQATSRRVHERQLGVSVLAVSSKTLAGIEPVWTAIAGLLSDIGERGA